MSLASVKREHKRKKSPSFQGGIDKRKERGTNKQNANQHDLQNDELESDIPYTATPLARNHVKRIKFRVFLKTQRSLEGNSAVGAKSAKSTDKFKSLDQEEASNVYPEKHNFFWITSIGNVDN